MPRNQSPGRFGWKNATERMVFINTLGFVLLDPSTPSQNYLKMVKTRQMLINYGVALKVEDLDGNIHVAFHPNSNAADANIFDNDLEPLIVSRACEVMLPATFQPPIAPVTWDAFEAIVAPFCELSASHASDTLKEGLQLAKLRQHTWASVAHQIGAVLDDAYQGDMSARDITSVFKKLLDLFLPDVQAILRVLAVNTAGALTTASGFKKWIHSWSKTFPDRTFASLLVSPKSTGPPRVHHVAAAASSSPDSLSLSRCRLV